MPVVSRPVPCCDVICDVMSCAVNRQVGSAFGGMDTFEKQTLALDKRGPSKVCGRGGGGNGGERNGGEGGQL